LDVYVICPSCNAKLAVPTDKARPKGICPRCQTVLRVVLPASRDEETQLHVPKLDEAPAKKQRFAGSQKPDESPLPIAYDFDAVEADEEPEPELVEPIEEPSPPPTKNKKKKKGKRSGAAPAPGNLTWIWWAAGAGTLALVGLITAGILIATGHGDDVLFYVVSMIFLVPCSMIILVVSMLIASAIIGGIDFGPVLEAIPKGILLLVVINSISLIPHVGMILAFPVWLIGLIVLFRLDFFEAGMLVFVNGSLNTIIKFFLLAMVLSMFMKPGHVPGDMDGGKIGPGLLIPPGKSAPADDLDRGLDD
jgi:hypothetical protein